ncbi:MAG: rRNA maturation RNase YbeY [Minisyncoccia bacterium]
MSLIAITETVALSKKESELYVSIAEDILGKKYECSLVVCGDYLSQKMNKKFRKKTYVPNVLSFPLDSKSGEMFLNIRKSDKESHKYEHSKSTHRIFLLIHGLLHLKGLDHGATMEKAEQTYLKKYTNA